MKSCETCDNENEKGSLSPCNWCSRYYLTAWQPKSASVKLLIAHKICEEGLHDQFDSDCVTDSDRAFFLKAAQIAYGCTRSELKNQGYKSPEEVEAMRKEIAQRIRSYMSNAPKEIGRLIDELEGK